MKVKVDLERCVGHGKCYLVAPEAFRPFDDMGHAAVIPGALDRADDALMRRVEKALAGCPEDALSRDDTPPHRT
jgi:ferredoxin